MDLQNSPTERAWDGDAIADQLAESLGCVVGVQGLGSNALRHGLARLREGLERRGVLLLPVDPSGASEMPQTMRGVTAEYARRVGGDERVHRLLDVATDLRSGPDDPATHTARAEHVRGAIAESWKLLSEQTPAVLLVLHPGEMSADDRRSIEYLVDAHFVDEVGSLVPELDLSEEVDFSVLTGLEPERLPWELEEARTRTLDVSGEAREVIRAHLADEEVVDRFVASTGGDPERLAELVEALPDNCESFWRFRYRSLDGHARAVVDTLAVAGRALPVATVRRILERTDWPAFDSSQIRELCDEGYLQRRFDEGTMRLELTDVDLRRGLADELPETRRAAIHGAIAEVCADDQIVRLDDEFLARHFLAAGDLDRGFDCGMRAARKLHATHALQGARELFETLLDRGRESNDVPASELDEIRWYLVDILSDLGDLAEAFEHLEALQVHLESGPSRWQIRRREARLRARVGEHERAERIVDDLTGCMDRAAHSADWAAAKQVGAEASYARGDETRAEAAAREAMEALDPEDLEQREAETMVEARNLLGRIALFGRDEERARELFDANRETADRRGWFREVTRAELNLAILDIQAGRFEEAAGAIEQLLDRSPAPTPQRRAHLLTNLGMAYQKLGQLQEALDAYREAFRAGRRAEDDVSTGIAAYNLATLCQDFGAYDRVLNLVDWLREQQIDDQSHRFVGTLPELLAANALVEKGEYGDALRQLDSVTAAGESPPDALPAAKCELRAVFAHVERGEIERATQRLDAVEIPDELGSQSTPVGLEQLGRALLAGAEENWQRAAELAAKAEQPLQDHGHFQDSLRSSNLRARALCQLGRRDEAREFVARRLDAFRRRAESIPDEFSRKFHCIPVYRRLADLAEQLLGELPEDLREPAAADEPEASEPEATSEAELADLQQQYPAIIGRDDALMRLLGRLDQVADSDSPVLIQGESGVGKELIAEAVHRESPRGRDDGPFVKVNCGAFVDNLLSSELFGHEEGAFTGAVDSKRGCFERADGGTIFLDEIGEISAKAQVALLRVLQEGEFERVGGQKTRSVDVRVVCATNRDLSEMVREETFRLDLYYRLKGMLLEVPPLRERRGDIPRLARYFADEATDGRGIDFSREALEFLASYRWPGNIRELRHLVETILSFVDGECVEMSHLREFRDFFGEADLDLEPPEIDYAPTPAPESRSSEQSEPSNDEDPTSVLVDRVVDGDQELKEIKESLQKQAVRQALVESDGNITRAAELLEMSRPRVSQIVNGNDDLLALKDRLVA
jgi:transcriptional regulator with GAF, ATPase, and Fis domain